MTKATGWLRSHQLIAYFALTYLVTWGLWLSIQPLFMDGQKYLAPLLSMGAFAPALVSIGLSAIINTRPRVGSRKPATIAAALAWPTATIIITLYLVYVDQMALSVPLVIISAVTGLLPTIVVSSIFSRTPAVKDHLHTVIRPRGSFGYYLVAFVLLAAAWFFGNLLSRALGMGVPFLRENEASIPLPWAVVLFFLYGVIYGGLTEEAGWRGFALPRLQAKFSPLTSSLILGVIWAVWHAPARFGGLEAKSLSDTLVEWMLIVIVTIIFTWLYNRTQGSILVTMVIHPAMNTATSFLTGSLGALVLLIGFMVSVIVRDKMWVSLPSNHLAIYREPEEPVVREEISTRPQRGLSV